MKLKEKFDISYGSKLDLNKLIELDKYDGDGVNFVNRSRENLGISAKIKKLINIEPFEKGLITVALGGSYLLSSFIQPDSFYTGQNVVILNPKQSMTYQEKIFYCICIRKNRYRYSAFGREANRTIKDLEIPDIIPRWVNDMKTTLSINNKPKKIQKIELHSKTQSIFYYSDIFDIYRGKGSSKIVDGGKIPLISSTSKDNGIMGYVDGESNYESGCITVTNNGSIGEAFYQPKPFCTTNDVSIFKPKFSLNIYVLMFLVGLIRQEKYRYNYGRKWKVSHMKNTKFSLPIDDKGNIDWQFMEDYIKSLPYSSNLIN